jgi:pimeloyl-ACP methyl ester carboxylesterase
MGRIRDLLRLVETQEQLLVVMVGMVPRLLRDSARSQVTARQGAGLGVLLVPGFGCGDRTLTLTHGWLQARGDRPAAARIGLNVGCTTALVDRIERRLEEHAEATGRRVVLLGQSRGGWLARLVAVRRPDLVRGLVTAGSPVLDPLGANPNVVRFGRTPGPREPLDVRGLSTALAAWLRATAREGALLLANSAGCQVVVDLAQHSPELLGPTVLVGSTVDVHARTPARQLVRLLADLPRERPMLWLVLARDYLTCGPRRLLATSRALLDDPVERKLAHLHTPTVVVRGGRDPIAPRAWAEQVAARLPNGRLAEVPGAGHALNYSAPLELTRITHEIFPV